MSPDGQFECGDWFSEVGAIRHPPITGVMSCPVHRQPYKNTQPMSWLDEAVERAEDLLRMETDGFRGVKQLALPPERVLALAAVVEAARELLAPGPFEGIESLRDALARLDELK